MTSSSMLARAWSTTLDSEKTSRTTCCVCLDECAHGAAHLMLPCCGRQDSATRCCRSCLSRICRPVGTCLVCRATVIFSGRNLRVVDTDESSLQRQPSMLALLLQPIWGALGTVLGMVLNPLVNALATAFEQAIGAVMSRGHSEALRDALE